MRLASIQSAVLPRPKAVCRSESKIKADLQQPALHRKHYRRYTSFQDGIALAYRVLSPVKTTNSASFLIKLPQFATVDTTVKNFSVLAIYIADSVDFAIQARRLQARTISATSSRVLPNLCTSWTQPTQHLPIQPQNFLLGSLFQQPTSLSCSATLRFPQLNPGAMPSTTQQLTRFVPLTTAHSHARPQQAPRTAENSFLPRPPRKPTHGQDP